MVIVQLIGGIGNQMFQYACARHLAILNNTELKLDLSFLENRVRFNKDFVFRDYDLDLFNIQATFITPSEIPMYPANWKINSIPHRLYNLFSIRLKGFKYVLEWKLNKYNLMLYNKNILKKRGNIYLAGYWASPHYFEKIQDTIRADFSFRKALPQHCLSVKENIQATQSVCINVRRKEFLVAKRLGFHGVDYINRAVQLIAQQVNNPVFFVFSDDISWCRDNIKLDFPVTFLGEEYHGEKYGDYLHLMTLCRHFIIGNSTYAWWGAWLSNQPGKIVVTPVTLFTGYTDEDLIPDEWLRA
ncbi:MAG TPA: alpha-1,2-fucosyltransferase [Saprospiraceae bacterium]|nr:alpha-1,2-fucosyltransferase [Saprospiraceae bacterium]